MWWVQILTLLLIYIRKKKVKCVGNLVTVYWKIRNNSNVKKNILIECTKSNFKTLKKDLKKFKSYLSKSKSKLYISNYLFREKFAIKLAINSNNLMVSSSKRSCLCY